MYTNQDTGTTVVYDTDPMYQTGKYIKDDADTLTTATRTFWQNYQTIASSATLPKAFQTALSTLATTCENPLSLLLTQRGNLGVSLENAAKAAIDLEDTLQTNFTPSQGPQSSLIP